MKLAGVDLAWGSGKKSTAIAYGDLDTTACVLTLTHLTSSIYGVSPVIEDIRRHGIDGLAIDAPLIILNSSGQRKCENALSKDYGSRGAASHSSNTTLCPNASSVAFSRVLKKQDGYRHLGQKGRWQIECYPHPSIVEIFGLNVRLLYKKGKVAQRKEGQKTLASLLISLQGSEVLQLRVPQGELMDCFLPEYIDSLKGTGLKYNEDVLDAVVCLYIAGLFALTRTSGTRVRWKCYGTTGRGYIWVPQTNCTALPWRVNDRLMAIGRRGPGWRW